MKAVQKDIAELRRLAALPDAQLFASSPISGWTPAEHVDHSVKVATSIVNRLLDLTAERGKPFKFVGRLILLLGWIPRGKGRSPERLRAVQCSREELTAAIDALEVQLAKLGASHLDAKRGGVVPHPLFGGLNPMQALRFTTVHTRHHLKIVRDVLRQATTVAR